MKIFCDDVREPPSRDWVIFRRMEDLYSYLKGLQLSHSLGMFPEIPSVISLDHDMGDGFMDGYQFLKHIEGRAFFDVSFIKFLKFEVHSQNPIGKDNMLRCIESINRLCS